MPTYIQFFADEAISEPQRFCVPIMQFLGGREDIVRLSRTIGPDHGWADLQRKEYDGEPNEINFEKMDLKSAIEAFLPDKVITINWAVKESGLAYRFLHELYEKVSPEIRGEVGQGHPAVRVGEHDIFEDFEVPGGQYFARTSLALQFWGYNIPPSIEGYREAIQRLHTFREILDGLSVIVGTKFRCEIYAFE
jgi:hypothetical protein